MKALLYTGFVGTLCLCSTAFLYAQDYVLQLDYKYALYTQSPNKISIQQNNSTKTLNTYDRWRQEDSSGYLISCDSIENLRIKACYPDTVEIYLLRVKDNLKTKAIEITPEGTIFAHCFEPDNIEAFLPAPADLDTDGSLLDDVINSLNQFTAKPTMGGRDGVLQFANDDTIRTYYNFANIQYSLRKKQVAQTVHLYEYDTLRNRSLFRKSWIFEGTHTLTASYLRAFEAEMLVGDKLYFLAEQITDTNRKKRLVNRYYFKMYPAATMKRQGGLLKQK